MNLKFLKTIRGSEQQEARCHALTFSQNGEKLAVCSDERTLYLYDCKMDFEMKDKFALKPANSKADRKTSFQVKQLRFSPDSVKLAVAQTDNVIYVYMLGFKWGDKKSIINKIQTTSPVTALLWPTENLIYHGLAEGKLRVQILPDGKCSSLYAGKTIVTAIANFNEKMFVAHGDGTLVHLEADGSKSIKGKLGPHPCSAYALAGVTTGVAVGGVDRRIIFYTHANKKQVFDFSKVDDEHEFGCAAANSNGTAVCFGSYDRLRIFTLSESTQKWSESSKVMTITGLYTITAVDWIGDGSKIACGSLVGSVELFTIASKKEVLCDGRYEVMYVGASQAVITQQATGVTASLKSKFGYEIRKVRILEPDDQSSFGDVFSIAWTSRSLIVASFNTKYQPTEINWNGSGDGELFAFQGDFILIHANGEINIVQFGNDEILQTLRVETDNCAHFSVRINSSKTLKSESDRAAYVVGDDFRTIAYLDLDTGFQLETVYHIVKINWLSLNDSGNRLVLKDKRKQLWSVDFKSGATTPTKVLDFCKWVTWIPGSDVLVAHDGNSSLFVWYNSTDEKPIVFTTARGSVKGLRNLNGKTEVVIVDDGNNEFGYTLDQHMIEFASAIDDGDLTRAMLFLEQEPDQNSSEIQAWWKQLENAAMLQNHIAIVQRCAAARSDHARVCFCESIKKQCETWFDENSPGETKISKCPLLAAKMAQLRGDLETAENLFIQANAAEQAIDMYVQLKKFDSAIKIAYNSGHTNRARELEQGQMAFYKATGQESRAAESLLETGQADEALEVLMSAGLYARAAKLMLGNQQLLSSREKIAVKLVQSDECELAGQLYEAADDVEKALRLYRKGQVYSRAVDLVESCEN